MKPLQRLLPLINAAMCALVLILFLADLLFPQADIFLNEFVKLYLLLTCLISAACGVMRYARQRKLRQNNRWAL